MNFKRVGLFTLALIIALVYIFINPSEVDFLPKCPLYITTGFYCAGCGSQRATHQLLNLNFIGVLQQNVFYAFALLLLLSQFIIISINKFSKKKVYNYFNHPKTPIIILVLVILFWILRNIPHYPFNLLAPK